LTLSSRSPTASPPTGGRDPESQSPAASHDGHMADRERDESGRPRSTRPRDALGRPLPPGSDGVPRIPDDLELPPTASLAYAQDLLNHGLAFNAHGITHAQRGNLDGATTLLLRGSARLGMVDHPAPYSVNVDGLIGWAAALADDLAAHAKVSPPRLHPALTKR
jgi:uncharacterized protein